MDNANSPAMPITNEAMASAVMSNQAAAMTLMGLTKREQIAAMAMQNCWYELTHCNRVQYYKHAAESCVAMADALLLALSAGKVAAPQPTINRNDLIELLTATRTQSEGVTADLIIKLLSAGKETV